MKEKLPVVAIVGRQNVGKSTLLNRLTTRSAAIVHKTPGVTRDRKYIAASWRNHSFILVDTGGVGVDAEGLLSKEVERQAFIAAREADVVLVVTDVTTGVTDDDLWLARRINRITKETILAVNKVDHPELESEVSAFYSLDLGDPLPISAQHGLGIGDLLDKIVGGLPEIEISQEEEEISVAIVGKPNVGKSSILNLIAGEERVLVHENPHTTRDAIDTVVEEDGKLYRLIDTAGLRKKSKRASDIEYYSSVRTARVISQADVVLLVIDGSEGATENDQRIARQVEREGRSQAIIINKWDIVENEHRAAEVMETISKRFRFASHIPLLRMSALTGWGSEKLLPLVDFVFEEWKKKVTTPLLNRFFASRELKVPPPSRGGRQLKIYYATQAGVAPPSFTIFVNDASLVKSNYRKFLTRELREEYGFWGSPLRLNFRTSKKKG